MSFGEKEHTVNHKIFSDTRKISNKMSHSSFSECKMNLTSQFYVQFLCCSYFVFVSFFFSWKFYINNLVKVHNSTVKSNTVVLNDRKKVTTQLLSYEPIVSSMQKYGVLMCECVLLGLHFCIILFCSFYCKGEYSFKSLHWFNWVSVISLVLFET